MGHQNVFPHVGRNVKVRAPNGRDVYPLVTGTFGGADFVHSLMGEATDHLSQSSVSDLTQKVNNARSVSEGQNASQQILRSLFTNIPGSDGEQLTREMDNVSSMRAGQPGGLDPSQMSPQEMHDTLWKILSFRDSVMKKIEVSGNLRVELAAERTDYHRSNSWSIRFSREDLEQCFRLYHHHTRAIRQAADRHRRRRSGSDLASSPRFP